MKFLDQVKIHIESGKGGAGCVGFRREKFIEYGGPDGGDGGRGGNVILEAANNLNTLIDFRYQQHFKAPTGEHGMGRNRHGADAPDLLLKVPVGTQVFDEHHEFIIADMTTPGQRVIIAKGGDGGYGNTHFKSSTNRAPRRADLGWPNEEKWIWLQLKLIADVGLVGLPNAGKSTFLAATSHARPKIADYPFTTLHPQLGMVYMHNHEFVLADIPGLIEGAHEGAGLGDRFLGHVERCAVLLHLVDGTEDDVVQSYKTIRSELESYGQGLMFKPEIIGLNKCDALTPEACKKKLAALRKYTKKDIFALSAVAKDGVPAVLEALLNHVKPPQPLQTDTIHHDAPWHPLES